MNKSAVLLAAMLLAGCAPPYPGDDAGHGEAAPAISEAEIGPKDPELRAVSERIRANLPEVNIDAVRSTPIPGLYEIQAGMEFAYLSGDGRYLLTGNLSDLVERRTLTEDRRKTARLQVLSREASDRYIEFAPEGKPDYTVTVFTDIDCGYCRMLHRNIKGYTDAGIRVRYAFFPRSGADTESFHKAEQVWCAQDRHAALTEAKAGKPLTGPDDCDNPVAEQLEMSAELQLNGTPAIILPDGSLIAGYQPPQELRAILDELSAKPSAAASSGDPAG